MKRVFQISLLDDGTGLKLAGELDLHNAEEFAAALREFLQADDVWLDMTAVTFIDSSGVRSILAFASSRNANGKIVIVDPTAVIGPVFKMLGLDDDARIEVRASRKSRAPRKSP